MKLKTVIRFFLSAFLFCASAWAQPPSGEAVTTGELEELIKTLESETARHELLSDLKTLLKLREEQRAAQESAAAGEESGLKAQMEQIKQEYHELLHKYGLDTSQLTRIMISLGAFGAALFLSLMVRMGAAVTEEKLRRLKSRFALHHGRFEVYIRLMRYAGYGLSILILLYALGLAWEVTDFEFLGEGTVGLVLAAMLNIFLILAVATVLWEVLNTLIEQAMRRADAGNNGNRLRTLLPIARNFLLLVLICLFTLVILSELGVDIMPLLAGAGIFGIAVGFGAQTFVKDLLTGFTIIFEDLIQVGDVVRVGGHIGAVEAITIRKIQLRDLAGIVYTVPFSEITTVENWTKNFSYYVMDIGIAYRESPDEVIGYLKEIGESMRNDEVFGKLILEPLEILGVDRFADSAVIIKARIKTLPVKQWQVGREFNRRMKYKFDEKKVEIPFPHRTLYFGEDKAGDAAPLRALLRRESQAGD
jgi:moderate conductance mechanosensitive channel